MSWASDVVKGRMSAAEALGRSFAKLKSVFGVSVSDSELDTLQTRAVDLVDKARKLVADEIDGIPGVPSIVADIAAQALAHVVDAAIAGAIEAAKKANDQPVA